MPAGQLPPQQQLLQLAEKLPLRKVTPGSLAGPNERGSECVVFQVRQALRRVGFHPWMIHHMLAYHDSIQCYYNQ